MHLYREGERERGKPKKVYFAVRPLLLRWDPPLPPGGGVCGCAGSPPGCGRAGFGGFSENAP